MLSPDSSAHDEIGNLQSRPGRWLAFEGIEGSGKSTLIKALESRLTSQGRRVHVVREPGGTAWGEKLRESLLAQTGPVHPLSEAHLFASSRAQLLHEVILPSLEVEDMVVLCDRFLMSSMAYQGYGRQLGAKTIEEIHQHGPLRCRPHHTFYLKIDLALSEKRQKQRGKSKDYFEKQNQQFYQRIVHGYDELCSSDPSATVLDGAKTTEELVSKVIEKVWP